jgi:CubicO group peptidase (beta-lactamase class C family)
VATTSTRVDGHVEPGFEGVRDAFAANFDRHDEVGAAFSLYVEGRKVVDIWGGVADATTGRPWAEDSIVLVFSTTKGATAVCANLLAQRGELDVDAPVVTYWPEFGQAGKEAVPVRWLLTHQAGLPFVDGEVTYEDVLAWDPMVRALERSAPVWEPGTAHGYHAVTYGWLVGEVVRRISGRSLGRFFADEIAGPLGLDFWIGLPEEQDGRVARLIAIERPRDPEMARIMEQFMGPDTMLGKALTLGGTLAGDGVFNRADLRRAELPAANGVTDARSLARMYAALVGEVDGVRILSPEQVDVARARQTEGTDRVITFETGIGLGFMVHSPFTPFGGPGCFGHPGAGGSVGFADPEKRLAFGYVMNRMQQNLSGDPRTLGLVEAAYATIA